MSSTIPDLWSDDIKMDVLSPLVILRSQASLLGRKTQGILKGEVVTVTSDVLVQHLLDLIAPVLDQYRATLLTATHQQNKVYPVRVAAQCLAPKTKPMSLDEQLAINKGKMWTAILSFRPGELPPNQREAFTQEEFIELVRRVFHSGEVRSLIQSLVARSNEVQNPELLVEQTPSDKDDTS